MSYIKEIVCLANSRKLSGRCIAGREVSSRGFGAWIRPVSDRSSQEIAEREQRYEDGNVPRVSDLVGIKMTRPQPQSYQQENHLITGESCWSKRGRCSWRDLQAAVEDPAGPLWLNGTSSSNGLNDRVSEAQAQGLLRSLYLVRPEWLVLSAESKWTHSGPRPSVRAHFQICDHRYSLVVTDPFIEGHFPVRGDGEIGLDDALLCLSLGEVFQGFAYKLVASVITQKRLERAA